MTQLSVTTDNEAYQEGQNVYPGVPHQTMSKGVDETTGADFGRFASLNSSGKLQLLRSNQQVATLSGTLSSGDVVTVNIVINGTTTQVQRTYATSSPVTVAALAADFLALDGIASATVSGSDLVITLVADAETDIHISTATAAGGSNPTFTLVNSSTHSIFGVTEQTNLEQDADGVAKYVYDQTASVMREGYIAMRAATSMAVGDTVFATFYDDSTDSTKRSGMVRNDNGLASNKTLAVAVSNAEVYVACSAGGLCVIRQK